MKRILFFVIATIFLCAIVSANQPWCGTQQLYFQHNTSVSPAGYEELINFPSGNTEVIENVSVINTGGIKLIDNYISPIGSMNGVSALDAGLRRYRVYTYVSSATGTTQLNFTKFVRHADGSETNVYTVLSGDINDLSVAEYDFNFVMTSDLPLNSTDRLGIRVSANTTHSSPISVYWVYQGTTHTSMLDSGFFVCNQPTAIQNISYTQSTSNATPLPVALFVAIIGILLLIGSILLSRDISGVVMAIIAPFPLIISAWQFWSIDIVTSYGSSAISTSYALMENHTIYTMYPVSIIMLVLFGISVLNIYRIVMMVRSAKEED